MRAMTNKVWMLPDEKKFSASLPHIAAPNWVARIRGP
jgi:hypothetical protein